MGEARPRLDVLRIGRKAYGETHELQQELVEKRIAGEIPDTLVLVEHDPVVTLGRGSEPGDAAGVAGASVVFASVFAWSSTSIGATASAGCARGAGAGRSGSTTARSAPRFTGQRQQDGLGSYRDPSPASRSHLGGRLGGNPRSTSFASATWHGQQSQSSSGTSSTP